MRAVVATYLCAAAAVAAVYLLRFVDARYLLWPSVGLDFSTHTAFATALLTSLAMFDRRWAWPALLALTLYSGLVVALRYHSVLDVVTASLVTVAITAALHWAAKRQPRP